MRYTLFILLFALAATFSFQSCSSCSKDKERNVKFNDITLLTKEDTTRVLNMTKEFMDNLKNGNIDAALDKLVAAKNDTISHITAEQRTKYKQQFERFPVLEYEIETSDFKSRNFATATYRYRFMDNPTDDPNYPVHMRLTIEVKKIEGRYGILLHDHKVITR